ncbi:glycosyltransferase family 4 protein [Microbacterium stercoris]|uniref:D-inositol 3-phosphate glycosyltransferase n=1 Tax=Microbacterium stercoris TaxID=2820289 RepID=A0A939QLN8_9MICO|nr:glycosyltransferase family 4 protein [Microbacterium stercoris]MBO3664974.1 glycosyltransferase family 4 protein [Microbacterium stercoris]
MSESRPRVVLASRLFEPEVSAGAFRLGALARALASSEAEVTVVTTQAPPALRRPFDIAGVEISRWPVLRDAGGNVRGYIQYLSFDAPLALRLLGRRVDALIAESPPTTGVVSAVVAWMKRVPLVYYAADVWTDGVISMGAPRPVVAVMRLLERATLRSASRILSVSSEVTGRLVALGADPQRIVEVGNGIDTDVFSPDVAPAAPEERYFAYTGTMSEWQRPDVFVRAFARIADEYPDVRLRFFGQGALRDELERLAAELLPGRVEFGGVVPPAEAAGWIRGAVGALVSITPGVGYDFARPTKTYAAAACGTPVLFAGARTGGELVREAGLGEAVAFTPEAVADAMRRLLADHDSGQSETLRSTRAAWVRENVSLAAAGRRAADAVLETVADRARRRLNPHR